MSDWEDDEAPPARAAGDADDSDDDDWDKEDSPVRKPVDSDDEDDWDKEKIIPSTEQEVVKDQQQGGGSAKKNVKGGSSKAGESQVYVPLDDPAAEKARQLKLQMEAEEQDIEEMFSGFVKTGDEVEEEVVHVKKLDEEDSSDKKNKNVDILKTGSPAKSSTTSATTTTKSTNDNLKNIIKITTSAAATQDLFNNFHLETQAHINELMTQSLEKITAVEKKTHMKGCHLKLLSSLLSLVKKEITMKDLQEMEKKIKEIIRTKKVAITQAAAEKQSREKRDVNKNTKFNVNDALDEVYGYDDDDWDGEEWGEGDWGTGEWAGGEWGEGEWKE